MRRNLFKVPLAALFLVGILAVQFSPLAALAQDLKVDPSTSSLSGGILPDCEASSSTLGTGEAGCGIDDATQLIYNVIKYVSYVIIPIAVLLLGYAGFTMMTSAGSSEKMTQAKHIIQAVITGLVIIFLSAMIVRYVFIALNSDFRPQ